MELHFDILDKGRRDILPLFSPLKADGFYLAGGTGLALRIGHRDSIDFDFFKQEQFDTSQLFERIRDLFDGHTILKTQDEKNTFSILIDDEIRVSFFSFPYPLLKPLVDHEYVSIASQEDIACMKLNAITGRGTFKDYVDLYFILQATTLEELMKNLQDKMPSLDPLLVLKSLMYFEDIVDEHILFKTEAVSLEEIKTRLTQEAQRYSQTHGL